MSNIIDKIELSFYKKNTQEFENFIVSLYKIKYPDLMGVKAQGSKGDGANDGYLSNKILLQVYSPETIDAKKTIQKMEHDFQRAIEQKWSFNEWHFIVNDKFLNIPKDVHLKKDILQNNNANIIIKLQDNETLKNMIINLLPEHRLRVYILLNIDKDISEFSDFNKVSQVIDAISKEKSIRGFTDNNFKNFSKETFLPDGIEKLSINIKNEYTIKQFGAYIEKSKDVIEEYKPKIGLDLFEETGDYIIKEYKKYNQSFDAEISLSKTFDNIYDKLDKDRNLETALWVVIAYYFDICDIGDI